MWGSRINYPSAPRFFGFNTAGPARVSAPDRLSEVEFCLIDATPKWPQ